MINIRNVCQARERERERGVRRKQKDVKGGTRRKSDLKESEKKRGRSEDEN